MNNRRFGEFAVEKVAAVKCLSCCKKVSEGKEVEFECGFKAIIFAGGAKLLLHQPGKTYIFSLLFFWLLWLPL